MEIRDINILILNKLATGHIVSIDDICTINVIRVGSSSDNPKRAIDYPHLRVIIEPFDPSVPTLSSEVGDSELFSSWIDSVVTIKGRDKIVNIEDCLTLTISKGGKMRHSIHSELAMQLNPFATDNGKGGSSKVKRVLLLTLLVAFVPVAILYIIGLFTGSSIAEQPIEPSTTVEMVKLEPSTPIVIPKSDSIVTDSLKIDTLNKGVEVSDTLKIIKTEDAVTNVNKVDSVILFSEPQVGVFYIVAGSFRTRKMAEANIMKLRKQYSDVEIFLTTKSDGRYINCLFASKGYYTTSGALKRLTESYPEIKDLWIYEHK